MWCIVYLLNQEKVQESILSKFETYDEAYKAYLEIVKKDLTFDNVFYIKHIKHV